MKKGASAPFLLMFLSKDEIDTFVSEHTDEKLPY
jgi:hypothetical protein